MPYCTGIADLPGFRESLRLLLEEEEYSQSDVAMMFGVSRERIRQLGHKLGVSLPSHAQRGLNQVRVWDDTLHRFRPEFKSVLRRTAQQERVRERKRQRAERRADQQRRIVITLLLLKGRLGRDPSNQEMVEAITGRPCHPNQGGRRLSHLWSGYGNRYTETRAELLHLTGIAPRAIGGAGHLPAAGS